MNIDPLDPEQKYNSFLSVLKDTYDLTNLVQFAICFKKEKGTLVDVILTDKLCSFEKTLLCETGLSDHHLLITTVLRSTSVKLSSKIIRYRTYKHF